MSKTNQRQKKRTGDDEQPHILKSSTGWDAGTSPWQDREILEELYLVQKQTTREIADELGCTNGTVSRWLNIHDIPTRENWRAGVEAAKRANRAEYAAQRTLPSGYEYWSSKETTDGQRTNDIVYVHRLLAVAEYGFNAVAGNHVHHTDNIPWDNRPENIEIMDPSAHGKMHSEEYWNGGEGE